jgi:subtilisin family serine protease
MMKKLAIVFLSLALWVPVNADERVATEVLAELERSGQVRVTVVFELSAGASSVSDRRAERRQQVSAVTDELIAAAGPGFELKRRFRLVPALAAVVDQEALSRLESHPSVRAIGIDPGGRGHLDVARPLLGIDQVHAPPPTGLGITGEDVKVVVMDSGIDSDNFDFTGALVDEACFCSDGGNGCCPGGGTTQFGSGSAEDDHGHGTWVTGHVMSQGNDAPRGAAPNADLVAVKVLDETNSFCCASDIAAAFDWIADEHPDAAVVNASLGTNALFDGECSAAETWLIPIAAAVAEVAANGTLMVASSGNQESVGGIEAPSCIGDVMAVGATYKEDINGTVDCSTPQPSPDQDDVTCFSNVSDEIEILAPGAFMDTTALGGGTATGLAGTSFAAPLVAGCAALIKAARPEATGADIRLDLLDSPVRVEDTRVNQVFPRLDCLAAVQALLRDRFEDGN